jgi:hypothetical protein
MIQYTTKEKKKIIPEKIIEKNETINEVKIITLSEFINK